MGLECLEFSCKHLVVCIAADHNHIIKLPEKCHFIGVQSKPCVDTLLDYATLRVFAKMLVVKYDIIFDKAVFKLSFAVQQILPFGVLSTIATSVVVAFCDEDMSFCNPIHLGQSFCDELKQPFEVNLVRTALCKSFVDLCIVTAVNEYTDRPVF